MKRAAILLDRDGTLNENPPAYVTSVAQLRPIPGAFEAVGRLCRSGWPVSVVTNQSGVGKGIMPLDAVEDVHRECERLAAEQGASFDGFYVCPHAPGVGCECRKPLPGLLLQAAIENEYDLLRSYVIGDSLRDLLAGRAAGATSLLVLTGHGEQARSDHPEELTFPTITQAVDWILARPEVA